MGTPSDDGKMKREVFALWLTFYGLVAAFGVFIAMGPRSGAGRRHSMAADTGIGTKGTIDASEPQSEDSLSQPAGAVSSSSGALMPDDGDDPSEAVEVPEGLSSLEHVYSRSFAFEQLESPQEAVLATTLDLWNSEAFKTLTLAEVRALGVAVKGYDLTGDGLLLDRIGGLPTEEDVLDALDHPEVVQALQQFLVADGIALEFALRNQLPEIRKDAIRARDAAQDGLFQSLDRASGYRHWALLGAVWRALDRE